MPKSLYLLAESWDRALGVLLCRTGGNNNWSISVVLVSFIPPFPCFIFRLCPSITRNIPRMKLHEITFQKGTFILPFLTVVGWNPTVQNQHSALDFFISGGKSSRTELWGKIQRQSHRLARTFSRRVVAKHSSVYVQTYSRSYVLKQYAE